MAADEESKEPQGADRRKSVRLEINSVTRFTIDGAVSVGLTRLINLGGLLMEVEKPLSLGSKVDVSLNLPTDINPFSARGEVVFKHDVRNRKTHAANEVGIKFIAFDGNSEEILKSFTHKYHEFNLRHSIYSKEMSTFADPSILKVADKPKKNPS